MDNIKSFFCPRDSIKERSTFRENLSQIIAVTVKNLLLFEFGLTLGFPTILIPSLSETDTTDGLHADVDTISWIGSINLICVPLGCILTGPVTQAIGRKTCMQLITIPFLASWVLFHFSTKMWHVFVALCMTGFSGGLLEAPVLTYVAEVTQPHLRGILSSASSMSVSMGFLLQFLFGTFLPWRQTALANCAIPILCLVCLCFIPETPSWLLTKKKHQKAKSSLAWLRGWAEEESIEVEFQEICTKIEEEIEANSSKTFCESLKFIIKLEIYWPMALVTFLSFLVHFNGTTTLTTYAVPILSASGCPIDAYYATTILGVAQLLGCLFCVAFINLLGKRLINFISLFGSSLCFCVAAIYIYLFLDNDEFTIHWIPVLVLIMSSFLSFLGIALLPWTLMGEVFPTEDRAKASGLASALAYLLGFAGNKIFPDLMSYFTLPGVFVVYSCVSMVGGIVLYFVLPETEGKTLHEISSHFKRESKLDNHVKRKKNTKENRPEQELA